MAPRAAVQDQGSVASVVKALSIIDFIGEHGPMHLTELVAQTRLPKSTLFRLLSTICAAGFLERTSEGYATTVKLWRLGAKAIDYTALHTNIISTLRELVDLSGETAHYSIYEDGYAVYVEKVEGLHPVRAYTYVGGRSPAYASATGKALLAHQPEAEIVRVAESATPHTAATLATVPEVLEEMAAVRARGVAVNRGEWREGVWGIAAPVFDHHDRVEGAVGLSGPQERIEAKLDDLSAAVREHAAALTDRLGGHAAVDVRAAGAPSV
jgi:DNA-binding IclR family transcriptional regulator